MSIASNEAKPVLPAKRQTRPGWFIRSGDYISVVCQSLFAFLASLTKGFLFHLDAGLMSEENVEKCNNRLPIM